MSRLTRVGAVVAVLFGSASTLFAQSEPRSGFWFGVGVGGGSGRYELESILDSRRLGPSGIVFAGGTISPAVMLGVEASGWQATSADTTAQFGTVNAVVMFYPSPKVPAYLKGGLGAAGFLLEQTEDEVPARYEGSGFGLQIGIGADFRIGSKVVLGAYAQWLSSDQDVKRNQLPLLTSKMGISVIQFGASIRYHGMR